MLILERILPLFSSLLLLLNYELTLLRPRWLYEFVGLSFIIIFLTVFQLTGHRFRKKELWYFFSIPLLLILGSFLFLIFLETNLFKQLLILVSTFLVWLFLENLFIFYRRSIFHQPYSLENISSYISLFAAFILYSSLFALRVFLFYPVWLLIGLSMVVTFLLSCQNFWVHKIEFKRCLTFLLVFVLIFAESFWAVYSLPTSYLVNGFMMTIVFYVLINLSRLYILGNFEKKLVFRYSIIAVFVIILILATAEWL